MKLTQFLILTILFTNFTFAQTWKKVMNLNIADMGGVAIKTQQDSILVVGGTTVNGLSNIWVTKMDNNGTILWSKEFDLGGNDLPSQTIEDSNGNFVIVGTTNRLGDDDIFFLKLNSIGNTLVQKIYRQANFLELAVGVIELQNGEGYALCGSRGLTHFQEHVIAIKVSSVGAIIWQNTYVNGGYIRGQLSQTQNGDLLLTGVYWDNINSDGSADTYLVRLNSTNGNLIWANGYNLRRTGISRWDAGIMAKELPNKNIIMLSGDESVPEWTIFGYPTGNFAITRLDSLGSVINVYNYDGGFADLGSNFYINSISELIVGGSLSNGTNNEAFAMSLNLNTGAINWQRALGQSLVNPAGSSISVSNGKYISCSFTDNFAINNTGTDIYIVQGSFNGGLETCESISQMQLNSTYTAFLYNPTITTTAMSMQDTTIVFTVFNVTPQIQDRSCTVLPVVLLSFEGTPQNYTNIMKWEVTESSNCNEFILEKRLLSDTNFSVIKKVLAKTDLYTYSSIDETPSDITEYRLKMVDTDGNIEYSDNVIVENNDFNNNVEIYPIPTSDKLYIKLNRNDISNIRIVNIYGNELGNIDLSIGNNGNTIELDISMYAEGLYFLKTNRFADKPIKFLKMK